MSNPSDACLEPADVPERAQVTSLVSMQVGKGQKTHRDEGRRASTFPVLPDGPAGDVEV